MKIDENALKEAAKKLRRLRLTSVGGRKEHPAETVVSVFEKGLGGMYDDEAITYALRHGIQYYLAAQHSVQADGAYCECIEPFSRAKVIDGVCSFCRSPRR